MPVRDRTPRPMAKAIAAGNIANDLIDDVIRRRNGRKPSKRDLYDWQPIREAWARIVVRHLDAYDQRER